MKAFQADQVFQQHRDLLFVGLILVCILFAVCGTYTAIVNRGSAVSRGGARSVDAATIKKQILDGSLSPRKALYYRKVPR